MISRRDSNQPRKHAIDADADADHVLPRFDVNITRVVLDAILNNKVHQRGHIHLIARGGLGVYVLLSGTH